MFARPGESRFEHSEFVHAEITGSLETLGVVVLLGLPLVKAQIA